MSEQVIVEGQSGNVKGDVKIVDGKAVAEGEAALGIANVKLAVELDFKKLARPFAEFLKSAIPGHFEDAILDAAVEKIEAL